MAEKIIKGMPFISGNKLCQEQTIFVQVSKRNVQELTETVTLIEDIWEDLKDKSGQWKWNGVKYFYWEIETTSLDDEKVKVSIEAPAPTTEIFTDKESGNIDLEVLEGDSDWTKYWKNLMKESEENYQEESKITETKAKTLKTPLVDYTPGAKPEVYEPEWSGKDIDKNDDQDLITNLQNILF